MAFLPNCFVHERKHRMPKRFANAITNIAGSWERSVHRDVTCNHVHALRHDDTRFKVAAGLIDPSTPSASMHARLTDAMGPGRYEVANSARAPSYEKFFRHDVVWYKSDDTLGAGTVEFLTSVEQNGETTSVVGLFKFTHVRATRRGHRWTKTDDFQLVLLASILGAVTWCAVGDHEILTLTPLSMR